MAINIQTPILDIRKIDNETIQEVFESYASTAKQYSEVLGYQISPLSVYHIHVHLNTKGQTENMVKFLHGNFTQEDFKTTLGQNWLLYLQYNSGAHQIEMINPDDIAQIRNSILNIINSADQHKLTQALENGQLPPDQVRALMHEVRLLNLNIKDASQNQPTNLSEMVAGSERQLEIAERRKSRIEKHTNEIRNIVSGLLYTIDQK